MKSLVERVVIERNLRGWSQRAAAEAGGTSNQTWSRFEASGVVTGAILTAVIKAFGWPHDWPENLPPLPVDRTWQGTIDQRISSLEKMVEGMRADLDRLAGE